MLDISTGNVDQGVYLTKRASSATYCLFNRRPVGHVHVHRKVRTLTELCKLGRHVLSSPLVEVQDSDPRAFVREANCAGPSDAMCSASHQRCRTVEAPARSENHSSRFARQAGRQGARSRPSSAVTFARARCSQADRPCAVRNSAGRSSSLDSTWARPVANAASSTWAYSRRTPSTYDE